MSNNKPQLEYNDTTDSDSQGNAYRNYVPKPMDQNRQKRRMEDALALISQFEEMGTKPPYYPN